MQQNKTCCKCGVVKSSESFYMVKRKTGRRGLGSQCKGCTRERAKAYRETDEGKANAKKNATGRTKQQRQEERARIAESKGKQYKTISGKRKERLLLIEAASLRRIADNVKKKAAKPKWQSRYLSEATRRRLRYRLDPEFNLKERMRRQHNKHRRKDGYADLMRVAINKGYKSPTISKALGYSIADLKLHLESLFTDGMCWDRFLSGDIHIDHVKPVAAHDLTNHDDLQACWSLSNLQPLWAKDNLEKSAKW